MIRWSTLCLWSIVRLITVHYNCISGQKWINKCAYHTEGTLEIDGDLMVAKSACATVGKVEIANKMNSNIWFLSLFILGQCLNTESLRVNVRAEEFVKGSLACMEDCKYHFKLWILYLAT